MLEVVDMAQELEALPAALAETQRKADAAQAKLEAKVQSLKNAGKTASAIDKATVNLENSADAAHAHVRSLKKRLSALTVEADRAAAAGNPWPAPGQLPLVAETRIDPKAVIDQYTQQRKDDLLERAKSGAPLYVCCVSRSALTQCCTASALGRSLTISRFKTWPCSITRSWSRRRKRTPRRGCRH